MGKNRRRPQPRLTGACVLVTTAASSDSGILSDPAIHELAMPNHDDDSGVASFPVASVIFLSSEIPAGVESSALKGTLLFRGAGVRRAEPGPAMGVPRHTKPGDFEVENRPTTNTWPMFGKKSCPNLVWITVESFLN